MQMVQRHMDEIDAASAGETWLVELAQRRGGDYADLHKCERDGGIRSVWKGRRLLAYYVVLRDQVNWTILACHDLSEDLEPKTETAPARAEEPSNVAEPLDAIQRRDAALSLAAQFGMCDEPYHKAWLIDRMVRVLSGAEYEAWVAERKAGVYGPNTHRWDVGLRP
ncbi:hypothetical protein [Pseudomonas serbica]|jgi:hypothetical protein|uniref:hypothetical protein n=1 Tax=Pseudomonas serbica TaxID=2965074 RepID=UPI00237BA5F9|nr:hypothetical protein [Pseudomonas serbica]